MSVDTTKVQGRRKPKYADFDELLADAESLAAATSVRQLGNWSLGKTLKHLGVSMEASIDQEPFRVPWWVKVLGVLYLRRRLVYGPFPTGLQLPRSAAQRLIPQEDVPTEEGLAALRQGIRRLGSDDRRTIHPVAGKLSVQEWNRFHLTHAEMHMSFLIPEDG